MQVCLLTFSALKVPVLVEFLKRTFFTW